MATLGLKEMGKFLWEGREKSLPHFIQTLGSHSKLHWENAKKSGTYYQKWVGRHASFPPETQGSSMSLLNEYNRQIYWYFLWL